MAIGNVGTYARVSPITTDFGDIVEGAVKDEEARKLREKAEEDAANKKKAALAKQFGTDYAGLTDIVTKTRSIDQAFARGVNSARDLMGNLYKKIEADPMMANDVDTQIRLQNLKNYSKNLKTISDRYTEYATMIGEGMQDGTLSNWNKNQLGDLDSIFRQANLDVRVDEETGLPIAVIAELDEDMQPTGELKELNLVEILDGRGLTQAVNTFDFQKSITDIGDKLGKREVKKPGSGLTHIEYQKFSDIEPEVRTMLKGFIGNEKNPTDIAKSIWADQMAENPKELTAADMKRIEDFYLNSIKGFYDEKNSTTKDFRTGYQYSRAAKEDEDRRGLGIQPRTDEKGRPTTKSLTGVKGDIRGDAYQFTLPKTIQLGIKGENRAITDLYLTPEGKIAFEETIFTGKKSGEKIDPEDVFSGTISGGYTTTTQLGGGLSTDELNDIARELNMRNAGELRETLEKSLGDFDINIGTEKGTKKIDTSKYN